MWIFNARRGFLSAVELLWNQKLLFMHMLFLVHLLSTVAAFLASLSQSPLFLNTDNVDFFFFVTIQWKVPEKVPTVLYKHFL